MTEAKRAFEFGPFRFQPSQHLLLVEGRPVRLGGRAGDILLALLEHPGKVVSKQAISTRVWPDGYVEEANLRAQVAALRKTLADADPSGNKYISNVAGRGYSFVADVLVTEDGTAGPVPAASGGSRAASPPATGEAHGSSGSAVATPEPLALAETGAPSPPRLVSRIVGRTTMVRNVAGQLAQHRFVTIIGPGGIGKTTVALSVIEALRGTFPDGIHFVDLAPLSDPSLVPTALAAVLGVSVLSDNPARELAGYLRTRNTLLVLDNCEHVIETTAHLAETAFNAGANVHILATSREPLGATAERVQRVPPLPSPPQTPTLTASEALAFAAVQIFADRAAASLGAFSLNDADAPFVADICRRLDGIPLAIEIAAGWIGAFGISGTAALLDNRFRLQMRGRRTALPRHKTMSLTLDWSHALLSEPERLVLRRLSVFSGAFTMDGAVSVLADPGQDAADVMDHVVSLIGKSLVVANVDGAAAEYRLLETTRAYAAFKLAESGEAETVTLRHARYFRDLLEAAREPWERLPATAWLEQHRQFADDVRSALDWSFGPGGEVATGIRLTIASVPLWFQLSLINECYVRATRARAAIPVPLTTDRDVADAMQLDATIAWCLMQTRGFVEETRGAWTKVLRAGDRLGDADHRLRALWGLWADRVNKGDLVGALALARQFQDLATPRGDQADVCVGDRMLGWTLHLLGDQAAARHHIERMLAGYVVPVIGARIIRFIFDQRTTARCFLARILWLQGFPDQAMRIVEEVIAETLESGDALSLCQALVQAACPLVLLTGELPRAERFVTMLTDCATRNAFRFWQIWARSFEGLVLARHGDGRAGLPRLEAAIAELRSIEFGVHFTALLAGYAAALGHADDVTRGLAVIDEALARSERNSERWLVADLLGIKADLEIRRGAFATAENLFEQALDWARRQQALSWELRAAVGLARLWRAAGRDAEARTLVETCYQRFTEGFETADLVAARSFLTPPE